MCGLERELRGGHFLSLRSAYISNPSLLLGLEPFEKFLVGCVVGGAHIVPVARLEDFRALKSSNLEDFRALKPYGQIGGF